MGAITWKSRPKPLAVETSIAVAWFSTLRLDPRVENLAVVQAGDEGSCTTKKPDEACRSEHDLHFDSNTRFIKWRSAQNHVLVVKTLTSYGLLTMMTSSRLAAKESRAWVFLGCKPCALSSVPLLVPQWGDWESASLSTLSLFDFSTRVATQISSHQVPRIHCIRSNHCFFCGSFPEVQFPAAFPKHLWSFGVLLSAMLLGYSPKSWQAT